jgi:hypothetical protein
MNVKDLAIFEPLLVEFKKERNIHRGRKMPYVLFGAIGVDYDSKANTRTPYPKLVKLNCSGVHGQESAIMNNIKAGMIVLDYWFPTEKDLPKTVGLVESGWVLRLRNGESNYEELERIVRKLKDDARNIHSKQAEIDALQKKVADLEKRADSDARRTQKSS